MMQKALFDYLKHRFESRIIITRVSADVSLAKRSLLNNPGKKVLLEHNRLNSRTATVGKWEAFSSLPLLLTLNFCSRGPIRDWANFWTGSYNAISYTRLWYYKSSFTVSKNLTGSNQCLCKNLFDKSNVAEQVDFSRKFTYPPSLQVLQRLIKSRGKSQSRSLNVQVVASEKLSQCPPVFMKSDYVPNKRF